MERKGGGRCHCALMVAHVYTTVTYFVVLKSVDTEMMDKQINKSYPAVLARKFGKYQGKNDFLCKKK